MKYKRIYVCCGAAFLIIIGACSIKPPEMRFTGEMTSLEREVLGTYEQITEDTWMIASTRSGSEEEVTLSSEKRRVLEAMRQQSFNKDDIEEFKQRALVGETKEGFLVIRNKERTKENSETLTLVEEIVMEENDDREIIMDRVVELNDALKQAIREDVLAIFAKMYQENSPKGTWIQLASGEWERK